MTVVIAMLAMLMAVIVSSTVFVAVMIAMLAMLMAMIVSSMIVIMKSVRVVTHIMFYFAKLTTCFFFSCKISKTKLYFYKYRFIEKISCYNRILRMNDLGNLSVESFSRWLQDSTADRSNLVNLSSSHNVVEGIILYDRADLLQTCIERCSPLEIDLLLKSTTAKSKSILHLAVTSSSVRVLRFVLGHPLLNIRIMNQQTQWGETALHIATGIGNLDVVQILLDSGSDEGLKDKWNRTAADIAKETGHDYLFDRTTLSSKLLTTAEEKVSKADNNDNPENGIQRRLISSEFLKAVQSRKTPESTVLVKNIFSVQLDTLQHNPQDCPEVSASTTSQQSTIVTTARRVSISKMVEYPGDPEALQKMTGDPEHYDINGKDFYGLSAIHKIASWNKSDLMEILLASPLLDVNVQATGATNKRFSALHFAIEQNSSNTTRLLMQDDRTNLDLQDELGRTAKQVAEEMKIPL
jgi:ankyrin repeat protein